MASLRMEYFIPRIYVQCDTLWREFNPRSPCRHSIAFLLFTVVIMHLRPFVKKVATERLDSPTLDVLYYLVPFSQESEAETISYMRKHLSFDQWRMIIVIYGNIDHLSTWQHVIIVKIEVRSSLFKHFVNSSVILRMYKDLFRQHVPRLVLILKDVGVSLNTLVSSNHKIFTSEYCIDCIGLMKRKEKGTSNELLADSGCCVRGTTTHNLVNHSKSVNTKPH